MNLHSIPYEHQEEILKMNWILKLAEAEFEIIGQLGEWLQDGGRGYKDIPPGIRTEYFYKDLQSGETHACRVWRDMGHGTEAMSGENWQELIHPNDREMIKAKFHHYVYKEKVMVGQSVFRIRDTSGNYHWLLSSSAAIHRSGSGEIFRYVGRDVPIGNRMEKELSLRQRIHEIEDRSLREQTLMEAAGKIAGSTDGKNLLLALEEASEKLFLLNQVRVFTRTESGCRPVLGPDLPEDFDWSCLRGFPNQRAKDMPENIQLWHVGNVAEGHSLILLAEGDDPGPELKPVMGILGPIILSAWERVRHFDTLRKHATTDPLTGAWNRREFIQQAGRSLRRSTKSNLTCAVAIMDIDHFKRVNDKFGHPFGDRVLVDVASGIKRSLRSGDFMCRWGGEEFALYLEGAAAEIVVSVVERIRNAAGNSCEDTNHCVSLSAGVFVICPDSEDNLESGLKKADEALLKAKGTGRNRTLEYSTD